MAREISIRILGDEKDLTRAFGRAESKGQKFGKAMDKASRVSAVGLGLLAGGAFKATQAASDLGEQINKTDAVFGKSAPAIQAWAKGTASSIGISNRAALEAAGTFGNMLVPMGIARPKAAAMSKAMVKLAADMASFNNASPEETLDALRSGLAGESEPLRKFGVFLSDARLKQEATTLGLYKGKGALDANAKAQATYALIVKDSADAQGDFGKTSDSLANQQRIVKAQIEDTAAKLGKVLLPAAQKVTAAISWLTEVMSEHTGATKIAVGIIAGLAAGIIAVNIGWKAYQAALKIATAAQWLFNIATGSNPLILIIGGLIVLGAGLVIAYKKSETFRNVVNGAFKAVKEVFASVVHFILTLFEKWLGMYELLFHVLGKIPGKFGAPFRAAESAIGKARDKVRDLRDEVDKLRGKKIKLVVDVEIQTVNGRVRGNDGLVGAVGDGVQSWAARNPGALLPPGGGAGSGGLKPMIRDDLALGQAMGLSLMSGYRPGSRTSSGNVSLHSVGQAIDMVGSSGAMTSYAHAEAGRSGIAEVIYSPVGWWHPGSGWGPITDAKIKRDHYSHVHVGARSGGDGRVGVGDGKVGAKRRIPKRMHKGGSRPVERKAEAKARAKTELPKSLQFELSDARQKKDKPRYLRALKRAEAWYTRQIGITRSIDNKIALTDALSGVQDEIASLEAEGTVDNSADLQAQLDQANARLGFANKSAALANAFVGTGVFAGGGESAGGGGHTFVFPSLIPDAEMVRRATGQIVGGLGNQGFRPATTYRLGV